MKKILISIILTVLAASGIYAVTVNGNVIDSETGLPIEGVTVRFVYTSSMENNLRGEGNGYGHGHGQGSSGGNGYNVYTTITDIEGDYILEELPVGTYKIIVKKSSSYPSIRIEDVLIEIDTEMNFELIPGNCEPPVPLKIFQKLKLK